MSEEQQYDLDSGDLCLDFANTNDWHSSEHPVEKLLNYEGLLSWGRQAGILSDAQASQLRLLANQLPDQAEQAYARAIELREAIYRIFSNRYEGKEISLEDLAILNSALSSAMPNLEIAPSGSSFEWCWKQGDIIPEMVVWPVARAAALLLTSEHLNRVRECEDDHGCGYLFIDQSKNRSRRWCSMESCGNRAKARRHYARQQDLNLAA
jgi:predicted RNA-binding Zn ribbon-like protein